MQAIHVTKFGYPSVLQLATVARPTPKNNEVLVKLTYSSVNFNDYMERSDSYL